MSSHRIMVTSHQWAELALWLPIIISWLGLLLTGIYIRLTGAMVRQMRDAREPSVYADVEAKVSTCNIIVGNCGDSPAFNVRLSFSQPSPLRDINNIPSGDKTLARRPIAFLAPKTKLKFSGGLIDYSPGQVLPDLDVRIDYNNEEGRMFTRNCRINLLGLENLLFETFHDPSDKIAEAIEGAGREINFSLENYGRSSLSYSQVQAKQKDQRPRVPCPACCEMVLPEARKCRFCHEAIKHIEIAQTE